MVLDDRNGHAARSTPAARCAISPPRAEAPSPVCLVSGVSATGARGASAKDIRPTDDQLRPARVPVPITVSSTAAQVRQPAPSHLVSKPVCSSSSARLARYLPVGSTSILDEYLREYRWDLPELQQPFTGRPTRRTLLSPEPEWSRDSTHRTHHRHPIHAPPDRERAYIRRDHYSAPHGHLQDDNESPAVPRSLPAVPLVCRSSDGETVASVDGRIRGTTNDCRSGTWVSEAHRRDPMRPIGQLVPGGGGGVYTGCGAPGTWLPLLYIHCS